MVGAGKEVWIVLIIPKFNRFNGLDLRSFKSVLRCRTSLRPSHKALVKLASAVRILLDSVLSCFWLGVGVPMAFCCCELLPMFGEKTQKQVMPSDHCLLGKCII